MAILHGLRLARRLGYDSVICKSDSIEAIRIINEENRSFHHYLSFVQDIHHLLPQPWTIEIQLVLRETNSCANFFAKEGSSSYVCLLDIHDPPAGMSHLLPIDSMGVQFPRV